MKKQALFLIALMFSLNVMAEKYGLIVAIGDYPTKTGWSSISSVNDVPLIKNTLLNQNFKEENITILTNAAATRAGILKAIDELQSRIKPGDVVVIHYSGHGQQIFDDNGDEIDDKDEALVPYDALVRYTSNYKGENHIRDDELGNIIANFRNTLGEDGQLLILLDSCHSGSATRGGKARGGESTFAPKGWEASTNKNAAGSGLLEVTKVKPNAAPFVMLSGASADELNYEYEGYGSLSFAFSKAMAELGTDFTYRKLFSSISANINVISPKQTPTIEGDSDYKLFKGDYVKQQPYFEVSKVPRPDIIKINAGKLQRLFDGTTVNILPAGTSKVEESNIITTGTITKATFNESIIKLDTKLSSENEKDYWVFVDQPSYGDLAMNIYFDTSLKSEAIKKNVSKYLKEHKLGDIVQDSTKADLILEELKKNTQFSIITRNGGNSVYTQTRIDGDYNYKPVTETLFNYAQGSYLKKLKLDNLDYEFEFKLLPAKKDEYTDEVTLLEEGDFNNASGKFQVNTTSDAVYLQVTNKSNKPLYFSIIEINSKGEIAPFMPNDQCERNDNERLIQPGKTMTFKDCIYSFGDPYETLVLKGFATTSPINFRPTVKSRGAKAGTRGTTDPLVGFIGQTYTQTRGSSGSTTTGPIDGYSTEFVYEIVRSKN
ncbi:caspase family protein [Winogradskyella thalassocola]|uniref:Caspase domain-containing protein n=1 Tax=Winogradskyella thalassocola TaxID=262004 RepID=A0A1G7YWZ2_9FLAO|nr:caspase family protein [Winogradskyella thalassocola]SDH01038.1 Caspase domain-containing protein [Winogradskyella thalassocola]